MKPFIFRTLAILGITLMLGGCASYNAQLDHGRSFKNIHRFFVVSNLNDNHAIDRQIAEVLQARGFEAETGPLTMMPENTQAIILFQDHWSWDFGDHLVFLRLSVRDTHSDQPYASVTFSAKIPLREATLDTVARLVDQLLDKK